MRWTARPALAVLAALAALSSAGSMPALAESVCETVGGPGEIGPVVVVALDGVPLQAIEAARQRGAFRGWPAPRPLISTFPSMTNVSFAAILAPLGAEPIAGYEIPHFDWDRTKMVNTSPFRAKEKAYGWRDFIEKKLIGLWGHTIGYAAPRRKALIELEDIATTVLVNQKDLLVVYIAGTDSLTHFRGQAGILRYLLEFDRRLTALQNEYRRQHGRCARLVLLSDHGNTDRKVRRIKGLRRQLRAAGFDIGSRLEGRDDAVAPTFGLCNYGALYVHDDRVWEAAESIAAHPRVELAAFVSGDHEVTVESERGPARLAWRGSGAERRYRYTHPGSDVLELAPVLARLEASEALDEDGFAAAEDWLVASASATYPNALQRIVDGLTGTHVRHSASVLFSIEPGYAWGRSAGYFGARLKGGLLEGTHGGLDAVSTTGFFLVNDPAIDPGRPVTSTNALSFLGIRGAARVTAE